MQLPRAWPILLKRDGEVVTAITYISGYKFSCAYAGYTDGTARSQFRDYVGFQLGVLRQKGGRYE